jgi:hypothetical protein
MAKHLVAIHYTQHITKVALVEGDGLDNKKIVEAVAGSRLCNDLMWQKLETVKLTGGITTEAFSIEEWPYLPVDHLNLEPRDTTAEELERLPKEDEEERKAYKLREAAGEGDFYDDRADIEQRRVSFWQVS